MPPTRLLLIALTPEAVLNHGLQPALRAALQPQEHFARVLAPLFGTTAKNDVDPQGAVRCILYFLQQLLRDYRWFFLRARKHLAARRVLARFLATAVRRRRDRLQAGQAAWLAHETLLLAGDKEHRGRAGPRKASVVVPLEDKARVLAHLHRDHLHKLLREWRQPLLQRRELEADMQTMQRLIAADWLKGTFAVTDLLSRLGRYRGLYELLHRPDVTPVTLVDVGWAAVCHADWGAVVRAFKLDVPRAKAKPKPKAMEELLLEGEEMLQQLAGLAAATEGGHSLASPFCSPRSSFSSLQSSFCSTPDSPSRRSPLSPPRAERKPNPFAAFAFPSRQPSDASEVSGLSAHVRRMTTGRTTTIIKGAAVCALALDVPPLVAGPTPAPGATIWETSPTNKRLQRWSPKSGRRESPAAGFSVVGLKVRPAMLSAPAIQQAVEEGEVEEAVDSLGESPTSLLESDGADSVVLAVPASSPDSPGPPIRIEVSGPPDGTGAPPTTPPGPSTPLAPSAPAPDRLSAADFFVALNDSFAMDVNYDPKRVRSPLANRLSLGTALRRLRRESDSPARPLPSASLSTPGRIRPRSPLSPPAAPTGPEPFEAA